MNKHSDDNFASVKVTQFKITKIVPDE